MKTKCEPGDNLKFPDGTEWLFVRYIEDVAIIASIVHNLEDKTQVRVVCKCCTPKLAELVEPHEPR